MMKKRAEKSENDQWDVASLYPNLEAWEADFKCSIGDKKEKLTWPAIASYQGRIKEGAQVLADLLESFFNAERQLMKLYTYAHLRHDEDISDPLFKTAYDRAILLLCDFKSETAWIQPEILQLSETVFQRYLKDETLVDFQVFLKKIFALKPHTLPAEQEYLLALAARPLEAIPNAFTALNNADLKFPLVYDDKGEPHQLTHASYGRYLESADRTLRKQAFKALHQKFAEFGNTLAELVGGQVQNLFFETKARHYDSCLHAALTPHQIDPAVYHNLIATVRQHLPVLHRYMQLRREVLAIDSLHCWDLHVSLIPEFARKYSFQEAVEMTVAAVAPLGEEYQQILANGLGKQRWADRYENEGKRSGAYSGGCYDSHPFMLLNYQGTFRDVMTLAHEAGHSMHSFFSRRHQLYQNADYPIFVAEVASTFNEELLFRYLLDRAESPAEKGYLLNRRLDDIRATLFRQTQFAEFELRMHEFAEKGIPLTASILQQEYAKLNADYYGPELHGDPEVAAECLRIPHFYSNFYVYQYATGVSAAYALCGQVLNGGKSACNQYLQFLSAGSSRYPLELLQLAGVDMCRPDPIEKLLHRFGELLDQLRATLKPSQLGTTNH
ncbi:MAG: oligoendopeptidase F [Chlamydiota bacterium]